MADDDVMKVAGAEDFNQDDGPRGGDRLPSTGQNTELGALDIDLDEVDFPKRQAVESAGCDLQRLARMLVIHEFPAGDERCRPRRLQIQVKLRDAIGGGCWCMPCNLFRLKS